VKEMDKRLTQEEWLKEMEEASKDLLFLADIEEVERDFAYADAEAARMIDDPSVWERNDDAELYNEKTNQDTA